MRQPLESYLLKLQECVDSEFGAQKWITTEIKSPHKTSRSLKLISPKCTNRFSLPFHFSRFIDQTPIFLLLPLQAHSGPWSACVLCGLDGLSLCFVQHALVIQVGGWRGHVAAVGGRALIRSHSPQNKQSTNYCFRADEGVFLSLPIRFSRYDIKDINQDLKPTANLMTFTFAVLQTIQTIQNICNPKKDLQHFI